MSMRRIPPSSPSLVVPVALAAASAAARAGLWLIAIGAAALITTWFVVRRELTRWRPVVVGVWLVADDDPAGRRAAAVASDSFGDRSALRLAAEQAPSARSTIDAGARLLDLVAVPDRAHPDRVTCRLWGAAAITSVVATGATGSALWLIATVVTSIGAIVTWSCRSLATRVRPRRIIAAATHGPEIAPAIAIARAVDVRNGATWAPAAAERVIERADLPPAARARAGDRLRLVRARPNGRPTRSDLAPGLAGLFGALAPWIVW